MHILFISNYFPPEVNAPATRLYEHAKHWIGEDHRLDVLTSVPNFPEGKVYEGYTNKLTLEEKDGIKVTRVPMYVTANQGTIKRTLSFISFMLSACWYSRVVKQPTVVVATSPQFFAAIAGYIIAKIKRSPFVLEIRDLWPESIVAVGASQRNLIIRLFEQIELFLYRKADHIVVVTYSFKQFIIKKGIAPDKITILKNGADLDAWKRPLDREKLESMRSQLGLEGKFVASYIGTIGMAHRADILLDAARLCRDPDIVFLIVGSGAEREKIEKRQEELKLANFRMIEKVSKEEVKYILALTDASVVHLKALPLFKTVIPSKIFEAMATRTPIIHGVEGESKEIIEEANAGIPIEPENAMQLMEAAVRLKSEPKLYERMAEDGYQHVHTNYDRSKLALRYLDLLQQVVNKEPKSVLKEQPLPFSEK